MAVSVRPGGSLGTHTLHPGDVCCANRDERLETLLGSCVAIVLTDPRRTVGAMCHVVHPGSPPPGSGRNTAYGEHALAQLEALLRARGITPRLCEAYLYGGGNMFPSLIASSHPGDANAAWAHAALARAGLHVAYADLGGNAYRKISWTIGDTLPTVIAVPI